MKVLTLLLTVGCAAGRSSEPRGSLLPPTSPLMASRRLVVEGRSETPPPTAGPAGSVLRVPRGGKRGDRRGGDKSDVQKEASRESLYEAYSLLHTLAKDFAKPIEAPAVLIVGHQTAGKSALVEALMGFQFNEVGGGTKTRRPIALNMKYNPACSQPACYLTNDAGVEQRMALSEIQAYILKENQRLEADPTRCFDHREISVRVEYRYCPNMVIIDTPGLISANGASPSSGRRLNSQERALAQSAREAENLVLNKMKNNEYIILCIEDSTDWKQASARALVMQADPTLSRTVLVNTKLDTKLLQFGMPDDIKDFIGAPLLRKLYPQLMGGPFFTSVPCGRVGRHAQHEFKSNEMFVQNLRRRERADRSILASKLGVNQAKSLSQRVGVRHLRSFLERRVEECYRRNVASIVPLLQNELRSTQQQLKQAEDELGSLSLDHLKKSADLYREQFARALAQTIQGSIKAPPSEFGETLDAEQLRGGSFHRMAVTVNSHAPMSIDDWDRIVDEDVGNAKSKLYGGAQYHRALREFAVAVQYMALPDVTEDEIANAGGMSDIHDGSNFMRAACVIAVEKAQTSFEPLLDALRTRTVHIMKRLFPIIDFMLESDAAGAGNAHTAAFAQVLQEIYERFVDDKMAQCINRCRDDLHGMTRFVTWDLKERGSVAVSGALPTTEMVEVYAMAVKGGNKDTIDAGDMAQVEPRGRRKKSRRERLAVDDEVDWRRQDVVESPTVTHAARKDTEQLLGLMEEVACMRDSNRTCSVITALVQHIVSAWRMSFAQNVAMKFNCFFLLPFLDEFPFMMRRALDEAYADQGDLSALFNIREARDELQRRLVDLRTECQSNTKLQAKFEAINQQLGSTDHLYRSAEDSGDDNDGYPRASPEEEFASVEVDDLDASEIDGLDDYDEDSFDVDDWADSDLLDEDVAVNQFNSYNDNSWRDVDEEGGFWVVDDEEEDQWGAGPNSSEWTRLVRGGGSRGSRSASKPETTRRRGGN